ncbi:MAG: competence protein ComEA [Thermoleophilaceae bacterium]|jgi:competence ComEA-like helix-hairpin-helix protein|nr:competence protein ComEA [Thermoleophilaceae bacterium]
MAVFRRLRGADKAKTKADGPDERRMSDWTLPAIPEHWLPPEVLQRTPSADPTDAQSPQDWVPAALPQPQPEAPRRARSTGRHQVPEALQPPAAPPPPPPADDARVQELLREREELVRQQQELRRSLEEVQAEVEATRAEPAPAPPAPEPPAAPAPEALEWESPLPLPQPGERLNINAAPVEHLMLLPGVGRRAAERIVEYREQHGPFPSVQALVQVKGFHPDRIKRFVDQASV